MDEIEPAGQGEACRTGQGLHRLMLRRPTRCPHRNTALLWALLTAGGCDSKKTLQSPTPLSRRPGQHPGRSSSRGPAETTQVRKKRKRYVYPGGDQSEKLGPNA